MIIKADARQLEWRVAAYLSQDKVAIQEILNGVDAHGDNQKRFGLPSRLIAKKYLFRLIYGGSAFSYARDPDFNDVGGDVRFWEEVIEKTYEKYSGLADWHRKIVQQVIASNGFLSVPSGREFEFKMYPNGRGELEWPRTQILNYPVQGFSADLMTIARISAKRRLQKYEDLLFIATVHDDIELDIANNKELCYNICIELEKVFEDIPENFTKYYGKPFNVPLAGEVFFGPDLFNMTEFNKETFYAN